MRCITRRCTSTERTSAVNRKTIVTLMLLILLCAGALFRAPAVASDAPLRAAGGYALSWWTVDGGGVTSNASGGYALSGTAGQPDAAVWSGGDYVLAGGFWGGVAVAYRVYLPLVMRTM